MSRYIDAEPYEQYLEEKIQFWRQCEEEAHDQSMFEARRVHNALFYAKARLKRTPTADVEEVKHGKWVKKNNVNYSPFDGSPEYIYICSECGREENKQEPYCNCGAKMDGGTQ